MTEYTLGLIFDNALEKVLLIEKERPDWQVGFLNGLGGKIEDGESPRECIVREVREESTIETNTDEWSVTDLLYFPDTDVSIFVFCLASTEKLNQAFSITDEELEICEVNDLPDNILNDDLRYLITKSVNHLIRYKNA